MRIIITAGGTGGHIYPALGVLDKIMENSNNKYLYIGTTNRMESEIIPSMNIPYEGLEIYGLSKNIFRDIKNIKCIRNSYKKCLRIIDEFKPDLVLGFGGYVSLPVLYAAKKRNIKIAIHEQNVIPGKTNKLLGKFSDKIFISMKESEKHFKNKNIIYSGNPCEERARIIEKKDKTSLGFDRNKKLIIIVMGSLGSISVNEKLCEYLRSFNEEDKEILFITGKNSFKDLNTNLVVPSSVKLVPYFDDLPGLMKDADLIISRAGAGAISEIIATSIPSILIPSPYVANNHQYYNALDLKTRGLCMMIEEKDLNKENLEKSVKEILDTNKANELREKLEKEEKKDASSIIYSEILELKEIK